MLLNREQVFSELGALSLLFSNLDTKLIFFLREHFADMISATHLLSGETGDSSNFPLTFAPTTAEDQEKKKKEEDFAQAFFDFADGSLIPIPH